MSIVPISVDNRFSRKNWTIRQQHKEIKRIAKRAFENAHAFGQQKK
jgi:hypothetical protein